MKKLSRDEMKNVVGGLLPGSCASVDSSGATSYNQTQAEASSVGAGGHWCCRGF